MLKSKHVQIKEILERELLNGEYRFGERLPTTKMMCKKYQVSDHVMTKAIKLLTEKGLLEAKVGSGIYSLMREPHITPITNSQYKNDSDLFFLPSKKQLLIWVEDSLPFQLNFWKRTFDIFLEKNIDIKVELRFGVEALNTNEFPDMIVGGISYFNNSIFNYRDLMDEKLIKEFYPNLYNGMLLKPSHLSYMGKSSLFPIGFSPPFMLCHQNNWNPAFLHCFKYLELFETASHQHPDKSICDMWNITNLLIKEGGGWINQETGEFSIQYPERWRDVLKTYRDLYQAHKVIWSVEHKGLKSKQEIVESLRDKLVFKEISMVNMHEYKHQKDLKSFPMLGSSGDSFTSHTENIMILRHTMYPEECLRVLSHFLSEETQFNYVKSELGFCIDKRSFARSQYKEYLPQCQNLESIFVYPPDKLLHMVVNEIMLWEIYHYLSGIKNNNILDRIELKIGRFLENIHNIHPEAFLNNNSKTLLSKYLIRQRDEFLKSNKHKEAEAVVGI